MADAPVFWSHLDAVPGLPGPLFAMTAPDAIGEATLGETPECNGRCGENNVGGADFFDVDRECPIHGDATEKFEWCAECEDGVEIADQFDDQLGFEEQARDVKVTALSCGHDIVRDMKGRTL